MGSQSDDEFGLASDDEADILELENGASKNGKRKSEEPLTNGAKRARKDVDTSPAEEVALNVLRKYFRMSAFRLRQTDAIVRLLDGESAVVVFPTGPSFHLSIDGTITV